MEISNKAIIEGLRSTSLPNFGLDSVETMNGAFAMWRGEDGTVQPTPLSYIKALTGNEFNSVFNQLVNDGNMLVNRGGKFDFVGASPEGAFRTVRFDDYKKNLAADLLVAPKRPNPFKRFFRSAFKEENETYERHQRRVEALKPLFENELEGKERVNTIARDYYAKNHGVQKLRYTSDLGKTLEEALLRGIGVDPDNPGPMGPKLRESDAFQNLMAKGKGELVKLTTQGNLKLFDTFAQDLLTAPANSALQLSLSQWQNLSKRCTEPLPVKPQDIYLRQMTGARLAPEIRVTKKPEIVAPVETPLSPEERHYIEKTTLQQDRLNMRPLFSNTDEKNTFYKPAQRLWESNLRDTLMRTLDVNMYMNDGTIDPAYTAMEKQLVNSQTYKSILSMEKAELHKEVSENTLIDTFATKLIENKDMKLIHKNINSLAKFCIKPPKELVGLALVTKGREFEDILPQGAAERSKETKAAMEQLNAENAKAAKEARSMNAKNAKPEKKMAENKPKAMG